MLDLKPATLTHNGVQYQAELGTINYTKLGYEDHGIFTFVLDFSFAGSGQGAGMYALGKDEHLGRTVRALVNFFGCDWEKIAGRKAFVLREDRNGYIRGLMDSAQSKVLIFAELYQED